MAKTPNFREFYQKAPITIGESDRLAVNNFALLLESEEFYTHWLIALEGDELNTNTINWKVVIYPTSAKGEFNYLTPYFVSTLFEKIHDAIEYLKQIEHKAKRDQLNTLQAVPN